MYKVHNPKGVLNTKYDLKNWSAGGSIRLKRTMHTALLNNNESIPFAEKKKITHRLKQIPESLN